MIHNLLEKKKGIHPSIFMVMLWVNLLSIVMVSGFNYFVFHRMSDNVYLESFVQYNRSASEMAFRNIDQHIIQSALHIPQLYFSPIEENASLLRLQEEVSAKGISAFMKEMSRIEKGYPYVESMDIYFEGTGSVVTGFDKVHFPDSEAWIHRYLPWYREWQEKGTTRGFLQKPVTAYAVEGPVITYVEKISQLKWQGKSIILAIHISPSSFGTYINEEEGAFTVFTEDNQILYDTVSYGQEELSDLGEIKWNEDGTPLPLKLGDNHITLFQEASSVNGLKYLYRIENSKFYSEYNETKRMFLLNFFISIGFNLLLLALLSYYNYATYRKRVLSASKEAGISVGQEKQSFNGSLNMLTKEISVLNKTINSSKGLLFQSEVRSIMLNKNPDAAYDKLYHYLIGSHATTFFLFLSEEDQHRLSIEQLQDEYGPDMTEYHVLFTALEKVSLVAVLLYDKEQKEKAEHTFIKDMDKRWRSYQIVSGLTFPVQSDGVWNSYVSTAEAARYSYIFPQEKWLTYEWINIEERKSTGSHLRLFEIMERAIKSENFSDFRARMEYQVVSFKNSNYTIDYCRSTLRDMVTLFYLIMQQNQLDMWVVFGYDIREYYKQILNVDEFHEWGNYLSETIIKNIQRKKKSVNIDMKEKITILIEENLEKEITLEFLADQLHIRQDSASRVFRQTMERSYTEYIKERKLNRAIELMEEGYTINEVAERLKYSSAQYFIKVFKESYGVTPHQFKINRKKELLADGDEGL